MFRPPIERSRDGVFRLRIGRREREVLASLPGQLEALMEAEPEDPSLRRLTPPAYADDPEAEAEYRRLVADELADGRVEALRTLARTADSDRLTADELEAWLRALNDLRLVLGTRLDVSEEAFDRPWRPGHPQAEERALYAYLSWLQEHAVAALSSELPDEG